MITCDPGSNTPVSGTGRGSACSVVVNQDENDPGGWTIELFCGFADADKTSRVFVQSQAIAAPSAAGNKPTRVVGIVSVPGAVQWWANVIPPAGAGVALQVGLFTGEVNASAYVAVHP